MRNSEDDKNEERFKNFMIFKFYGTDEDVEKAAPIIAVIIVLALITLLVLLLK